MKNSLNTSKVHVGSRTFLLPEEMTHLYANSNYTVVNLSNGSQILSSTTLSIIERRLTKYKNFFRVNKSVIVNLNYAKFENNEIVLNDNRIVLFSRRRGKVFKNNFKSFSS
jgi:DNA-binding LytR/AlgR family response regulator